METLYKDVEQRMAMHFKLINYFLSLIESDTDMVERYGYAHIIEPLRLFPKLFKVRELKQSLMVYLR